MILCWNEKSVLFKCNGILLSPMFSLIIMFGALKTSSFGIFSNFWLSGISVNLSTVILFSLIASVGIVFNEYM